MGNRKATLDVSTVDAADGVIVRLAGPLDIATSGELEQGVTDALTHHDRVALDLADVTLCDSTGLGASVRLHRRAQAAGKVLEPHHPRPHIADLLAMTGINKLIRVVSVR